MNTTTLYPLSDESVRTESRACYLALEKDSGFGSACSYLLFSTCGKTWLRATSWPFTFKLSHRKCSMRNIASFTTFSPAGCNSVRGCDCSLTSGAWHVVMKLISIMLPARGGGAGNRNDEKTNATVTMVSSSEARSEDMMCTTFWTYQIITNQLTTKGHALHTINSIIIAIFRKIIK